jgi:hypothetical protein
MAYNHRPPLRFLPIEFSGQNELQTKYLEVVGRGNGPGPRP